MSTAVWTMAIRSHHPVPDAASEAESTGFREASHPGSQSVRTATRED